MIRLRFRDWMWPLALIVVVAIPYLGHTNGTYKIGSITYYANEPYAYLLWLAALVFVGIRWFAIGMLRPRISGMCGRCNYQISRSESQCCPECGADEKVMNATRRISIARILIDLPSVVCILFPMCIVVMSVLLAVGIIDGD